MPAAASRSGNVGVRVLTEPGDSFVTQFGTSAIAMVGTAPEMAAPFVENKCELITEDNLAALGTQGTLPKMIQDARAQGGENGTGLIVVLPVAEGVDEDATLANVTGSDLGDTPTGVYGLLDCESETGVTPGIVIATGHTHQLPAAAKNPVVTAFEAVLPKLSAHGIIDCPDGTSVEAADYAAFQNTRWLAAFYPWLKFSRAEGEVVRPPSATIAGRMSAQEIEQGIHYSMLNTPLIGVGGITKNVSYNGEDTTATYLGDRAVGSIVRSRKSGFLSYGDETTLTSEPKQFYSLAVSRTIALISLSIKWHLHDKFLGEPMNPGFWSAAVHEVEAYLDPLVAQGVILEYRFRQHPTKQTPEATAARLANFLLEVVPAPPARSIDVWLKLRTFINAPVSQEIAVPLV